MNERILNWHRLPERMKMLDQWTLAGASKAPLSVDSKGKLYNTSVTRPSEWMSFDQAVYYATFWQDLVTTHVDKQGRTITQVGLDIGFMLSESDEFAIIDADVKDAETHPNEPALWTTPDQFDRYWSIAQTFDTYVERSRSGKGLHIITLGNIGPGFRRDGIEIYSQERFIICTGDVVINKPVQGKPAVLENMVAQMRPLPKTFSLVEEDPEEDDWSIELRAINAANSEKFIELLKGDWAAMGYPSQSEADLALMSIFTFYSRSNEQCRRLFRNWPLGRREKAVKNDAYLNHTLRIIRTRQFDEDARAHALHMQTLARAQAQQPASRAVTSLQAPMPEETAQPAVQAPAEVVVASLAPVSATLATVEDEGLPWPPGMAGTISKYIFEHSIRPVKEVSVTGCLGLLAGICGKAWYFSGSGLNLYITLVARSGIGKEAMHSGISSIIHACTKNNATFHQFINFSEMASGQALTKALVAQSSFVNVQGEWGKLLRRMARDDGRNGPLETLRTQMTNLYQKSGPTAIVGGITYSNEDNNVVSQMSGVNYSMIGETTPDVFYQALTPEMMADGFMSRFLIIEYEGERPDENLHRLDLPDAALTNAINSMAVQADLIITKGTPVHLGRTSEAAKLIYEFSQEADGTIRGERDEAKRQMWNRAALMAQRIAGLLAVADNWHQANVTVEHVQWAILVVRRSIALMKRKLESGDVGVDDDTRERKLVSIIREYEQKMPSSSYGIPPSLRESGIIPRKYLQMRTSKAGPFVNHRLGSTKALEDCLQSLVRSGYLVEAKADVLFKGHSFHGIAYSILKLPEY